MARLIVRIFWPIIKPFWVAIHEESAARYYASMGWPRDMKDPFAYDPERPHRP